MIVYTAEDFEQADLATRGEYGVARRADPRDTHQWYAYGGEPGWFSDEEMAADGWTPVVEPGRLSLARLEAAWEAAEAPTDENPIREGDVVIYTSACGTGLTVHKAAAGQFGRETHGYVRILSRAPKREPWEDLADALRGTVWERLSGDVDGLAAAVHAAGWRKGGEES